MRNLKPLILSLRPQQWIKNSILFSSIFFNGKLFDSSLFILCGWGFLVFCFISSASYLANDVVDLPFDQKHPTKKKRPLASGEISVKEAVLLAVIMAVFGLVLAFLIKPVLVILAGVFILLHLLYSFYFKKHALLDIFAIAFSFLLRILASEILSGYHLSVWLFLTIFFASLFIAAAKRHAELVKRGAKARQALYQYQERLLNFYVTIFATSAILSYILFAFWQPKLDSSSSLGQFLISVSLASMVERKWLLLTTPLVVFGIARYAHLVYVGKRGERPEKLITTDPWIISSIGLWSVLLFALLYL
jgi:decaprenyl-phosphate phosphoribosyltransferase